MVKKLVVRQVFSYPSIKTHRENGGKNDIIRTMWK
jgi:hypothetical protein